MPNKSEQATGLSVLHAFLNLSMRGNHRAWQRRCLATERTEHRIPSSSPSASGGAKLFASKSRRPKAESIRRSQRRACELEIVRGLAGRLLWKSVARKGYELIQTTTKCQRETYTINPSMKARRQSSKYIEVMSALGFKSFFTRALSAASRYSFSISFAVPARTRPANGEASYSHQRTVVERTKIAHAAIPSEFSSTIRRG